MKKIGLIVALAALAATPALAADMAVKAPPLAPQSSVFSWTGPYVGADIGGIWGRQNADTFNVAFNASNDQAPDFVTLHGSSFIGGAYAGYNVQFGNWVAGFEADWSAMRLSANAAGPNNFASGAPASGGGITFSRSENWIATLRARFGVIATPNVLLYVTGGGAWTRISYSGVNTFIGGCPNCSILSTSTDLIGGLVAGGGVELAVTANWIFRVEYLRYDFEGTSQIVTLSSGGHPSAYNFHRLDLDEVRAGVSYKFN
jgi:outer membrane immunogenic protein